MADLLNFDDDDTDTLFKPQEQPKRPARSLDDIFGTTSETTAPASTLDDVLVPTVQDDIFETKTESPKKKETTKTVDNLFGDNVDDEPDFFSSGPAPKTKTGNISNPLEEDLLGDFLTPSGVSNKEAGNSQGLFGGDYNAKNSNTGKNNADDLDDLFAICQAEQADKSEQRNRTNDFDDIFAVSQSEPATQSVDQSEEICAADEILHDESEDSLDMLLDAQPTGTVTSCDDLLSLVDPPTNTATSTNMSVSPNSDHKDSQIKDQDPLDDFFGATDQKPEVLPEEEVDNSKLPGNPEQASEDSEETEEETKLLEDKEEREPVREIEEKPVSKPRTNLKKSMERSFEDLLNGLSDESEPELDDMIVSDIDNTNLESLLESPNKSVRENKQDNSLFTTPSRPVDLDIATSTPMEKTAESPIVKVPSPEVRVHTPDDEENDREDWAEENTETNSSDEDVVVMRPKKEYKPETVEDDDDDDLDLEAIEDTNHLDVDVSKHKSALGKTGSMALRRKPSRKSRKSLLSSDEDAIFRDSTDSKPVRTSIHNDEELNGDVDDNYDLSPPAKKPSPAVMMPLPGMAGRPPSQRKSASTPDDDEDNAMDTKEVKRLSKPPPGAFVLPSLGPRPPKPQNSPSATDKPPVERPAVFEKPALKSVKPVEKSRSPEEDRSPGFSRAGLRSTERQEVEKKSEIEEKDVTFQKPSLRSTPKPPRERTPEEKMDTGMFEKPALRSTPKVEQKPTENKEGDVFESRNLRSVNKQEIDTVRDSSSDKHGFDKPSLRSTGIRLASEGDLQKEESSVKTFEKPALRTTNKDIKSDSLNTSSEHSHTFDKPSLKKTTPSPEKETKDINEPKGIFDRPALRKTDGLKEKEKPVTSDKPEWLQQAASKHTKVLEMIHTKENHQSHTEKEVPSWLEKSPLKKTRALPLQDTSNGQSTSNSQSDMSNIEDTGRLVSTPRSRNSSVSSDRDTDKKRPSASTAKENHNNYTPSWMRQSRSPSVPTPGVLGPAKSLPSLTGSSEVPQWKRELAQRRANRKEKTPEELPKKDEPVEPDWKKGIALRKTRATTQPSKDVKTVEPEWKKAAEEKHARLRTSSVRDKNDLTGHT